MGLPDPVRSRAVIIGVDAYLHLRALPSVADTVHDLAALLRNHEVWGLNADHCKVLLNPQSPQMVLDTIQDTASEAEDAFVVYFAGHGLVSPSGDLYLALPTSEAGRLHWAVSYEDVRRVLVEDCVAPSKVTILDCCYSGRALVGHMGAPVEVATRVAVEGTYVMTSSSETKLSWAPEGEKYTAFSGELITALEQGIPGGPELLDMETLFWHVRGELAARSLPAPQQRARNAGHYIALAHNRWTGGRTGNERGAPIGNALSAAAALMGSDPPGALVTTGSPGDPAAPPGGIQPSGSVEVIDIRQGRKPQRIRLETLTHSGGASQSSVLQHNNPLKSPMPASCLLGGLCTIAPVSFAFLADPLHLSVGQVAGVFISLYILGFALIFRGHYSYRMRGTGVLRIDADGLYVQRYGWWIFVPWKMVRSLYTVPTLSGPLVKLDLEPTVSISKIALDRYFGSTRNRSAPLPLCPFGWGGFDAEKMRTALKQFSPAGVLDPTLEG